MAWQHNKMLRGTTMHHWRYDHSIYRQTKSLESIERHLLPIVHQK